MMSHLIMIYAVCKFSYFGLWEWMTPNGWSIPDSVSLNIVGMVSQAYRIHVKQGLSAYRMAHFKAPSPSHNKKQNLCLKVVNCGKYIYLNKITKL